MFIYLISEVLCNIYQVYVTKSRKVLLRTYCNVWIKRGLFKEHFQSARQENYHRCVSPKFTSKIMKSCRFSVLLIPKRRHAAAADKNCIPINTYESRFSKSTLRIKSKNISFERLFKAQDS